MSVNDESVWRTFRIVAANDLWEAVWGNSKPPKYREPAYLHQPPAHKTNSHGLQIETMVNVGYRLLTPPDH